MFDFVNFLRQKWAEYTGAESQKGTVIDELAVKPTGLMMSDFYNSLVDQRRINDIENWEDMTEDELDYFGNKFYTPRIEGGLGFGYVRIYFDEKKTIDISDDFAAVSTTGLRYVASHPRIISRNSFKESGERAAKYYVDVNVTAAFPGDEYNIDVNEITLLEGVEFSYKRVTNPEEITGGARHETNEEYYSRLVYTINDRSMMNKRSTYARLKEFFPYVNSIYIAGSGDKYMTRDIVQAIDLSIPQKKAEFLGKIPGNNTVNNSAYYGVFPPEAGTRPAAYAGPFSIYSNFKYPLTIESVNLSSDDPAYHGFPLDQESTAEMYQGLYFDDYKNFMEIQTVDLFNIIDEDIGLSDVLYPSNEWIIGANGRYNGDYGTIPAGLSKIDIVRFNNNLIELSAGSSGAVSVSKDINKRTGIKLTGVFKTPDAADNSEVSLGSGLQFMVGGVNGSLVDAYTGIGWGFRINTVPDANPSIHNAVVYFAHSEKYGSGQVFAATDDFIGTGGHVSVANINALAERTTRLTPNSEYEFEFTIYDNLSLSLYISKLAPVGAPDPDDIFESWLLPETILNVFAQEINDTLSTHYGTMMKVTLDTHSTDNTDKWQVTDLKAFDVAEHRANALMIFDVAAIEPPFTIEYRGSGSGSINGSDSSGYSTYIWDTEKEAPSGAETTLQLGGWTELEGVSNPTGLKDEIAENLTHDLSNVDQYKVTSRFGDVIILLVTTTGTSEAKIKAKGSTLEDIYSQLRIDYVKVRSQEIDTYHAKNKADIYVNTLKSSDDLEVVSTSIDKAVGEPYFVLNEDNGFSTPIADIVSVTVNTSGTTEETLSADDYTIVRNDTDYLNSKNEDVILVLNNQNNNSITVEYTIYRDVARIQDFYDSSEYGKVLGDILIKHKFPCYLDISIFYSGTSEREDVANAIKVYVDDNVDDIFSVRNMLSYLYDNAVINNAQEPIEITYEKVDDDLNVETGTFTDTLEIRKIDFFRVREISVDRL